MHYKDLFFVYIYCTSINNFIFIYIYSTSTSKISKITTTIFIFIYIYGTSITTNIVTGIFAIFLIIKLVCNIFLKCVGILIFCSALYLFLILFYSFVIKILKCLSMASLTDLVWQDKTRLSGVIFN